MSFEYFQEVISDLETLLETGKGYDVIIYAGENKSLKEIYAHSLILYSRSQYFCGAFSNEWVKKENGKFIFEKPNISPQLFKIILRFIYCGKVDLTELQVPELLKLLIAVDELNIQTLIACIQEYLIKSYDKFLQQNLVEILQIVYQHELFTDLRNYCFDKINTLFNSDKFINLELSLLEFVLKHDNLNIDEIDIWENLVKWVLAQEKGLDQDVSKWNQNDFDIFRNIFYKFIPLIRFHGISSEDYYDKVKPYEEILSKELRNDILKFYMVPAYKPKYNLLPRYFINSNLINRNHIIYFSNWIDKNEIFPYKFKLLYRASTDGNTASTFHAKCDNKGATIVIAKIINSDHLIGGYNPLFWDSYNGFMSTKDSFIFSFTNRTNLQTAKVSYIKYQYCQYSIYCNQAYGPTFGGGHDLSFQYNNTTSSVSYNISRYYPIIDIPENFSIYGNYKVFTIEDYEVFQVMKKNLTSSFF